VLLETAHVLSSKSSSSSFIAQEAAHKKYTHKKAVSFHCIAGIICTAKNPEQEVYIIFLTFLATFQSSMLLIVCILTVCIAYWEK